jgi:formylmethanofuran dehydrogenase subunit C
VSGWSFKLRHAPKLRIELDTLRPSTLASLDAHAIARLPLAHGSESISVGDLFAVSAGGDASRLAFEGDLSRFDRIGAALDTGELRIDGPVGDQLGLQMTGGSIVVNGSARHQLAVEMAGGRIEVRGDVGDFAAATLPGSLDGMRGGTLVVHGRVGDRFADRMRRGFAIVHGDAGDFAASRLVAGTVVLGAGCGAHPGYGMRRGTLVFGGAKPAAPPPTFVETTHDIRSYWALLARELKRLQVPFAASLDAARVPARWVGDIAVAGKGEWLLVASA